jgi:hypothetical protein
MPAAAALLAVALFLPSAAKADPTQNLSGHEPESWAMFFYQSATSFAGVGAPRHRDPWTVDAFVDLYELPQLDAEERTVGFSGTKTEDLNKAPVFGRPGLVIGLPWDVSMWVGYIPPIEIFGVRAHLVSLAFEKPVVDDGPVTAGLRLHTQVGQVRGPYTCPENVTHFPPGSDGNPYGCNAVSNDAAIQRTLGLELAGSYRIDALHGLAPYLSVGVNYLNGEFHVKGVEFDEPDRTRMASDTVTFSLGSGLTMPITDRLYAGIGVFWTPLWVTRPPATHDQRDSMVQVRSELTFRLH